MRHYCDIKKKSKHSHIKSRSHKEFEKYNQIILSFKNVDIKAVDEILYLYIKDYNKKLVFNTKDCKKLMTVVEVGAELVGGGVEDPHVLR